MGSETPLQKLSRSLNPGISFIHVHGMIQTKANSVDLPLQLTPHEVRTLRSLGLRLDEGRAGLPRKRLETEWRDFIDLTKI